MKSTIFVICGLVVAENVRPSKGVLLSLFDFLYYSCTLCYGLSTIFGAKDIRVLIRLSHSRWLNCITSKLFRTSVL